MESGATNRWVNGVPVATDEKYGRLKQLMEVGKEKGFVLYDEVNELLAEDFPSGREFEDLLTDLDSAGVEILEEPKLDFEKKTKPDDFGDLELPQDAGDKTNDPVRMYLREMGTVPLLTREGEIELAKRNERGQWAVRKALSRSASGDSRNHPVGRRPAAAESIPSRTFWFSRNSSSPTKISPPSMTIRRQDRRN